MSLSDWHDRGGIAWRVTPQGVEATEGGVLRTPGEPVSVRMYWAHWTRHFLRASEETDVPIALLLMTVCTENGAFRAESDGRPRVLAPREEPGYRSDEETPGLISIGPCHLLISTARGAMGDPSIDRAWLTDVGNNLLAAARYIASQADDTGLDPVLVAGGYNAGGLFAAPEGTHLGNRWHLKSYGTHLDRAAAWYGDACALIGEARELVTRGRVG